jgi:hypothetical protein
MSSADMRAEDFSLPSTGQIAQSLAAAVIGKLPIPGPFGALIMSSIFPSGGLPSYFNQVYQQIRQIVREEITQDDIDLINGKVNGIQNWIATTYTSLKLDPARTPSELLAALTPFVDDLFENVIGVLTQEHYAQPGFSVFLIAAGVHLSLLQEQALNDPDHQDEPSDSPFARSAALNAANYADFIDKHWPDLLAGRGNQVSLQENEEKLAGGVLGLIYYRWTWWWADALTGATGPSSKVGPTDIEFDDNQQAQDTKAAVQAQCTAQAAVAQADFTSSLGDPATISQNFRTLAADPRAVFPARDITFTTATCTTVQGMTTPAATHFSATVSWASTGAVSVELDGVPQPLSGELHYAYVISERGADSGTFPPYEIAGINAYRQRLVQQLEQRRG